MILLTNWVCLLTYFSGHCSHFKTPEAFQVFWGDIKGEHWPESDSADFVMRTPTQDCVYKPQQPSIMDAVTYFPKKLHHRCLGGS